jgi:hypothetical protein
MGIANSRRARHVVAGVVLAGTAVLVSACQSPSSSTAASSASTPVGSATSAVSAGSAAAPVSATAAAPSVTLGVTASATGATTFLAPGQDIKSTALHEPGCLSGCPLSGDSTAILSTMKWSVWSATEAVGTGTYKLDDCNPNCAAGVVSDVAAVVTLGQPVKVCSAAGTRWYWSRASFSFPKGLPSSLRGASAPQNPWVFSTVVTAAKQSCDG